MSDFRAAQIIIGGCLSRALMPGLCTAIRLQQVALDWGEEPFLPQSAEELLACHSTFTVASRRSRWRRLMIRPGMGVAAQALRILQELGEYHGHGRSKAD